MKKTFDTIGDLKLFSKQLKTQVKRAQEKKKQAEKLAKQAEIEKNIFRHHMADVMPLKAHGRALLEHTKPLPLPTQRLQDNQEVMFSSLSDELDVETLLDTDEALSHRKSGISLEHLRKLRRGHWKIQKELDLHGYRRDDAREALYTFLRESCAQGLRCVRIIHGKGHGSPGKTPILKAHALSWLIQSKNVLAYTQARPADGGAGALIVMLKPSQGNSKT